MLGGKKDNESNYIPWRSMRKLSDCLSLSICFSLLLLLSCVEVRSINNEKRPVPTIRISSSDIFFEIISKSKGGDTYLIRNTINLKGRTVALPENCTLRFEKGQFKNGRVIFDNTMIEGKAKFCCEIEGKVSNDTIRIDWFIRGNKYGDKIRDISRRVQTVFSLGASNYIFGAGHYKFAQICLGKNVNIIGKRTIIHPVVLGQNDYHFSFLKNVFYANDADTVIVKGLLFEGTKTETILPTFSSYSIYGEPLIWIDKAKKVVIERCTFKNIENCTYCNKGSNYYGKKQGSCVCLWDVTDASYINCEQVGNRHDEQIWIIAVEKPIMNTKASFCGNYIHDMTPGPNSSAFTCVSGMCLMENNTVDRFFYPGSMFNVFAKKAIIRNNVITDSYCSSVFDVCEYSYFHNDDILVEGNHVDAVNSVLVLGQSAKMTIKNNVFRGLGLYYSANNRVQKKITKGYKYWYSDDNSVLPTDEETIIDGNVCDFTAYDGNRSIAGTKADYGTGEILQPQPYSNIGTNYGCGILIHPNEAKAGSVVIINNSFFSLSSLEGVEDKNNLANLYPYTIKLVNTQNATIKSNIFTGCYSLYRNVDEKTCISVYNYPDVMEKFENPAEISKSPSQYGTYLIEDNTFNVQERSTFYPLSICPRVNSSRNTQLVIDNLVIKNNIVRDSNTGGYVTNSLTEGSLYKTAGSVKILKEVLDRKLQ